MMPHACRDVRQMAHHGQVWARGEQHLRWHGVPHTPAE
ncbi:hypothetical protein XOCgx_4381 [Xanthomonas oryzae pv. oryzicola]|nr:hypothetical protein XOCgx_4381 [Xanthomonas oryzae pv. oryzicola]